MSTALSCERDWGVSLASSLVAELFLLLEVHDAISCAQVNTHWHRVCKADTLWRRAFQQRWPPLEPRPNHAKPETEAPSSEDEGPLEKSQVSLPATIFPVTPPGSHPAPPWRSRFMARYSLDRNWEQGCFREFWVSAHALPVFCLQYDQEKVISADKAIQRSKFEARAKPHTLGRHTHTVLCLQYDSERIFSGSADHTIKVWRHDGECLTTLRGHFSVSCLQPDLSRGRLIAGSQALQVWDMQSGQCTHTLDTPTRCLQAEGDMIWSGDGHGMVKLWDLRTENQQCIRSFEAESHPWGLSSLHVDGPHMVTGGGSIKLWDIGSGQCIQHVSLGDDYCNTLKASASSSRIVAGTQNGNLIFFNPQAPTGQVRRLGINNAAIPIQCLAMDDERVVFGSGCYVQVWDFRPKAVATACATKSALKSPIIRPPSVAMNRRNNLKFRRVTAVATSKRIRR